jgi:2'-5' RNA ligase
MIRTFIAINLDSEITEYIFKIQGDIAQLRNSYNMKVKFVEKDNLHISLKFLGDLNSIEIEKIKITLQNISNKYRQFTIGLSENVGIFPNCIRPRVLWIGIAKGNDTLLKIFQSIEKELRLESYYQKENQFTAHITLARIKYIKYPKILNDYIRNIQINSISQRIKAIDLMESQLTKDGPIYKIISSFTLVT